jgi:hypothetical protein
MLAPVDFQIHAAYFRGTSFESFVPRPVSLFFSQSASAQAEWEGGVIMPTLRALLGAWQLIAVMGIVVSAPLGWTIVLGIAGAYPEKLIQDRPYQRKAELVQKKILPPTMYEQIKYKIVSNQK